MIIVYVNFNFVLFMGLFICGLRQKQVVDTAEVYISCTCSCMATLIEPQDKIDIVSLMRHPVIAHASAFCSHF